MKAKQLLQRHPEFDPDYLSRLAALYEGGQRFREHLAHWLPKQAAEPEDVWRERRERAYYLNYSGPIVDYFAALLFTEPAAIAGLDGPFYESFWADVDRRGTDWSPWWRDRFLDALIGRRAYAWVSFPARPEGVVPDSRADEERLGLDRAYLVPVKAHEVIDWEEDDSGVLRWVLVHQVVQARPSVEAGRSTIWRWTYLDAEVIRRWEWVASPGRMCPHEDEDIPELPAVPHHMGVLPVVRLELPSGLWALSKLCEPAVAQFRERNALSWALNKTAHAMPIIKRQWGGGPPIVGTGYYIALEREDEFSWSEPPGTSYPVLQASARELREELYRVVHQMALSVDTSATASARSGDSKAMDHVATEVVLGAYSELVREAMRRTLAIVAAARGEDAGELVVRGLDAWGQEDLETFLRNATTAQTLGVPSPTYKRLLQKRVAERMVGPDTGAAVIEAIRKEIDEAPEEPGSSELYPAGAENAGEDAGKLQDTALNGAQIDAAKAIVEDVAKGLLPRATGVAMLVEFFDLDLDRAERIMGEVGRGFEPATPPPPEAGGAPGAEG